MTEQTYTVTITASQLNVIGAGLLELPGKIGNPVIAAINQQVVAAQLQEQPQAPQ